MGITAVCGSGWTRAIGLRLRHTVFLYTFVVPSLERLERCRSRLAPVVVVVRLDAYIENEGDRYSLHGRKGDCDKGCPNQSTCQERK